MSEASNAITNKVKIQQRPLSQQSGVASQFICVKGDYIKNCARVRISNMQTQGSPFAEANKRSYNPAVATATANPQAGTSVISKSAKETKDALAKQAEQSKPSFEIAPGFTPFHVISYLGKTSDPRLSEKAPGARKIHNLLYNKGETAHA
jgi:hypothetical protein